MNHDGEMSGATAPATLRVLSECAYRTMEINEPYREMGSKTVKMNLGIGGRIDAM